MRKQKSPGAPSVSIVIPTYNRENAVVQTVRHLLANEVSHPLEIIVVDQSESSNTELGKVAAESEIPIKIENKAYQNVSRARNDGAESAINDVLIFIDDDVMPRSGFVESHVKELVQQERMLVTGPILEAGETLKTLKDIAAYDRQRLAEGKLYIANAAVRYETPWAATANLSCRKRDFQEIGGFDQNIYRFNEDAEFCHRATKKGFTITYSPECVVDHAKLAEGGTRTGMSTAVYADAYMENLAYYHSAIGTNWAKRIRVAGRCILQLCRQQADQRLILFSAVRNVFIYVRASIRAAPKYSNRSV